MVAGHLQTKKGYYYMVLNLKDEKGKRTPKWLPTGIQTGGTRNLKQAEDMLLETRIHYKPTTIHETGTEVIRMTSDMLFTDYMEGWLGLIRNSVEEATYAARHDLIQSNPMDKVDRPKAEDFVGAFYSMEEVEQLFEAAKGDPAEFPILMAAFYGLRRSEVMGLRWQSIDFESNTIRIDHKTVQFSCEGKEQIISKDSMKNKSSRRSLPLVPQFRDLLLRMKARQANSRELCGNCYVESDYIYVNDLGQRYKPNYVTQHFKILLRKHGLRNIRYHDLRHTCASLLLKNGVPMKDIQAWLGHSDYSTTANTYTHLETSSKQNSAARMASVMPIDPGIQAAI